MRYNTCVLTAFVAGSIASPVPSGVPFDVSPEEKSPPGCKPEADGTFGIFAITIDPDTEAEPAPSHASSFSPKFAAGFEPQNSASTKVARQDSHESARTTQVSHKAILHGEHGEVRELDPEEMKKPPFPETIFERLHKPVPTVVPLHAIPDGQIQQLAQDDPELPSGTDVVKVPPITQLSDGQINADADAPITGSHGVGQQFQNEHTGSSGPGGPSIPPWLPKFLQNIHQFFQHGNQDSHKPSGHSHPQHGHQPGSHKSGNEHGGAQSLPSRKQKHKETEALPELPPFLEELLKAHGSHEQDSRKSGHQSQIPPFLEELQKLHEHSEQEANQNKQHGAHRPGHSKSAKKGHGTQKAQLPTGEKHPPKEFLEFVHHVLGPMLNSSQTHTGSSDNRPAKSDSDEEQSGGIKWSATGALDETLSGGRKEAAKKPDTSGEEDTGIITIPAEIDIGKLLEFIKKMFDHSSPEGPPAGGKSPAEAKPPIESKPPVSPVRHFGGRQETHFISCKKPNTVELSLQGGNILDSHGRTGYIASNHQFQFDAPPQAGSLITSGFSTCDDGLLALGGSKIFYECPSGNPDGSIFYNLYDSEETFTPGHCRPVHLFKTELQEC